MTLSDLLDRHAADRRRLWNQVVSVGDEHARRLGRMVLRHHQQLANHVLAQVGLELVVAAVQREKDDQARRERRTLVNVMAAAEDTVAEMTALKVQVQDAAVEVARLKGQAADLYGSLDLASKAADQALTEASRLRRHLLELDELVVATPGQALSTACRRVLDVALGREVERTA